MEPRSRFARRAEKGPFVAVQMSQIRRNRVLMLVENNFFQQDPRVLLEAQTLVSSGYQVSVICPAGPKQSWREKVNGTHVFRYPSAPYFKGALGYLWEYAYSFVATFALSLFIFMTRGFDIIHAANPPDTMVFIAAFYKIFGKRFIYDHHDLAPELYYARFGDKGNKLIYLALIWLERLSCLFADHIITTNHSYRAIEIKRGHVPEERVTVVRNGPNEEFQYMAPEVAFRQQKRKIIAYSGTIGIQDGVENLLVAIKHIVKDIGRTDLICVLLGDGDALLPMRSLAMELDVMKYILFKGWVDRINVARYLSAADICVAPEPSNPYNDRSTMIKIIEYMAIGKPIVAFDLPEHRVSAQDAALYARRNDIQDFANKIVSLMDDGERSKRMGQFGRERIEKELSWSHQKKYLLTAYDKLRHDDKA
jgi:glycosyltransferase involved in cell wall biosynthesis